jgi:hypothetical protein
VVSRRELLKIVILSSSGAAFEFLDFRFASAGRPVCACVCQDEGSGSGPDGEVGGVLPSGHRFEALEGPF